MARRAALAFATLALTAALCGCIAYKEAGSPDPDRRDHIDAQVGERFRVGVSTREDVLLALGEPWATAADGRWLEYRNTRNFGHWSVFGCGVYACGGFELDDKIRHRTLTLYFDAADRLQGIDNVAAQALLSPELRLVHQHVQAVLEPGEAVVERLLGARWRATDGWRPGVLVLTERAILFLEATDSGPAYRLALRLPAAGIRSVDWAEEPMASAGPHASVRRVDGGSEAFALTRQPSETAAAAPGFDRERTQHFIDLAGWLPSRAGPKPP